MATLSAEQSKALLDILTHHNTYQEIRDFRIPGSLEHYGPPFTVEHGRPSSSPALQSLVSRFLLNLPGLNNLSEDFWKVQCHDIIQNLERANLSESYDKGSIGSRKTLSTAISSLIEYPVRGTYGGFRKVQEENDQYDLTNAEDLFRAFRDFLDQSVYGSILEDLVDKAAETDQLSSHTPMIKAVHEFVLVNLASFMHYTLVLSPKGQYLLKLIDNANKLVPYMIIRQTLKIGNVATMINAMMKVVLAKMSVSTLTNWIGLTQSQNEGMNLMQQIISTVLNWDNAELEKRGSKLEKERADIGKQQLKALKDFTLKSQEDQEKIRQQSMRNSVSIVTAVLQSAKLESELTEPHHKHALEYLGIQLSIRDRKELIQVLCHSQPDHLTQSMKELLAAYDPIIRHMHQAIDLSDTVNDFEKFLKDMLKLARIRPSKDGSAEIPTVADFIQLLRKHQFASHKFIHQCCKNDRELTGWYLEWAKDVAAQFRRDQNTTSKDNGAGDLTEPLNEMFSKLPKEKQKKMLPLLDAESKYIENMHNSSLERLAGVLKCPPSKNPQIHKILNSVMPGSRTSSRESSPAREPDQQDPDLPPPKISSDPGPGSYLARWQDLLDNTPITPLTQEGAVKKASSAEVVNNSGFDVTGAQMVKLEETEARGDKIRPQGKRPNVKPIVEAMAEEFRSLLAKRSCYW